MIWLLTLNLFAARLCLIDTGVRDRAAVFKNRIVAKYDCTGEGVRDRHVGSHGTGTAGVAAEYSDHDLVICKALAGRRGLGKLTASLCCIRKCVDQGRADWVSMSFGGVKKSRVREKMVNEYAAKGVRFSASHGNRYGGPPSFPGQLANVVSVRGVDKNGTPYKFNSGGKWGAEALGCLYTYDSRGRMVWRCGTSFANPLWAALNLD